MKREYIKPQIEAIEIDNYKLLIGSNPEDNPQVQSSDEDTRLNGLIIDTEGENKVDNSWEIF